MKKFFLLVSLIRDIVMNVFTTKDIVLVSEGANWVINEECKNVRNFLELHTDLRARISLTPTGLRRKVIHFFSKNTFIDKKGIRNKSFFNNIHPSNRLMLSWFHISKEDTPYLQYVPRLNNAVDMVHTASTITKNKLIENKLAGQKIIIIPLGVDTSIFEPIPEEGRLSLRRKLHLPEDAVLIGSFQKDGHGWGEGVEPKLIKGPDIFCDVVEKLAKQYNVHVLLTGPSRGYVKNRLAKAHIPFTHVYLKNYLDILPFYQVLDLYIISSREEGGPKALLETMATGVPLVSTRVGMVPDIVEDGREALLANIEDVDTLAVKAALIISDEKLRRNLIKNSLQKIKELDLLKIESQFYDMYKKIKQNL